MPKGVESHQRRQRATALHSGVPGDVHIHVYIYIWKYVHIYICDFSDQLRGGYSQIIPRMPLDPKMDDQSTETSALQNAEKQSNF